MNKLAGMMRRFSAWRCRTFHVRHWQRIEPGKRQCGKCDRVYKSGWHVGGVARGDKRLPS